MFTGLIEELGVIKRIVKKGNTLTLVIQAEKIMRDLHEGDSISVNGVCLTVTKFSKDKFEADVMPEPLNTHHFQLLRKVLLLI